MPFTSIERLGAPAAKAAGVPPMGVRVLKRNLRTRSGTDVGFISIRLGAELSRRLGLTGAGHPVGLAFGDGNDTGKIAVTTGGGEFAARGKPGKAYQITINKASADGLFAWDFPTFERAPLEVLTPARGGHTYTTFAATADMLSVED